MRNEMKGFVACLMLCFVCGCASWVAKPANVILLPEERIYTVPAGQMIKVNLDQKPLEMTFPEDMKLVSPTVLVRQEQKLNEALLDKIKAAGKSKVWMTILGIIAGVVGIFFGKNFWPKIKANIETK